MTDPVRNRRWAFVGLAARALVGAGLLVFLAMLAGCSPPAATLDLITVARQGLTQAQQAQAAQQELLLKEMTGRQESLDAAFDADVRLVESGQIKDADGKPVALSSQWIISARRGYIAARDALAQQKQEFIQVHAQRMDNLLAAQEALDMASQLIVQQQNISIRLQQQLLNAQRTLSNGK